MSQRITSTQMHEFFNSAIASTSDFVTASRIGTRTKKLYFIDDLSAAKAYGRTEGNCVNSLNYTNVKTSFLLQC